MKPNFLSYQLTDEFIETVKTNPTVDAIDELFDSQFNEVASSNNNLNWDATYLGPSSYVREYLAIGMFIMMYFLFGFFKEGGGNMIPSLDWMYFTSIVCSSIMAYATWSTFSGFIFHYRFNDNYIAVKRYKNEPEIHYKIARITGWVGSIACIILAFVFSPLIFIGAGGFALASFSLINMKREPYYQIAPYDSILYIQKINKENELELVIKEQVSRCNNEYIYVYEMTSSVSLYLYDHEKMDEVINLINEKVGYDVEYYESEDDESSVNLYQKSRKLGTPLNRVTINKETLEMTHDVFTEDE
ncbi:hypothetical protein [Photobacterium sanguinicancri]|uniref:hypothetical protein n=2 Tax=Photobacterium sanguinicancri TaxID=875932 RepID=UPI0024804E4E|nr:hypothetical protein [Photobacterium sanguinicancri]